MRCLFWWVSLAFGACTPTTGKVDIASESGSSDSGNGADEEGDVEGGGDDGEADSADDDEADPLTDLWEEVMGFSVLSDGEALGVEQDVWFFQEELGRKAGAKDGHDTEEREPGPACVLSAGDWEPVCVAFTGEAWGTMPELNPEEECREYDDGDGGDWGYTDEGCPVDPKAVCLISEGTSYSMKVLYYTPMPLSEAEDGCAEAGGTFYPLADDDWDDDEEAGSEAYELGMRWVGMIFMDNTFGIASFEHFNEAGENCKADAQMVSIDDVDACAECAFSKRFVIGEFVYEIDEGGCPDDLAETEGLTVTFGHGRNVIYEDADFVLHSLWYLDEEE